MANVIGPDVSFYQDEPTTPEGIDFIKMSASAGYVIIRAGQNTWVDSDFKYNWREAKNAKLPRGSYWFYDSRTEPKKQAELWVDQFQGDLGELPLFADFEENYNGPYKGWKNWYTFLERLKALVNGHEIAIYTAYYYWKDNAPNATTQASSLEYFKQYPLWIANYGATDPLIPLPWKKGEWLFWQYTESGNGKLYGVESNAIDLNYFNGDLAAFKARFKLSDSEPEPIPGNDQPTGIKYLVNVDPSVDIHGGPDVSYNLLGQLLLNEKVEEINATASRTWLKVRKEDGSLSGWCVASSLKKVEVTPPPTDGIRQYRVTASPSLKSRQGPGLTYATLGTYPYGSIVTELKANADRTWLQVKNQDGSLVGWSFAEYLEYTGSVPPTPPVEENKKYRVTSSSLQVMDNPNVTANVLGLVYFGEVVEGLEESTDKNWLKIKNSDGSLNGWCLVKNLLAVEDETTNPPVEEPTTTIPEDKDKTWYKVKISSVAVRESPDASAKLLGTVIVDDTLPALDDSSNTNWMQIRRMDGLTGWCEKNNFSFLSATRPVSIKQNLFKGVTLLQKDLAIPRKNRMFVLAIDLLTVGLEFLVTPSNASDGVMCTRTPAKFLEEFKVGAAINGDGFSYLSSSTYPPATTCPNGGEPVKVNGFAASRGKVYSSLSTAQPTVYLSLKNQVTINQRPVKVFNAVSGDRLIVQNGVTVKNLTALDPSPRTAIGVSKNGRWLILMVVDGRQAGTSEGVTLNELAALLISYGVYSGANMDGGGSSAMVIKGIDGLARIVNSPVDQNTPGKQRAVANHLGIFVK